MFEKFCEEIGVQYRTEGKHTSKGWVQIECPFCGRGTGKFHLGYSLESGAVNCWKCGTHSVFSLVYALTGKKPGKYVDKFNLRGNRGHSVDLVQRTTAVMPRTFPLTESPLAMRYIQGRKFSARKLERLYNVSYGGSTGPLKYRIVIPIYDKDGMRIVSYVARAIGKMEPRYLSARADDSACSIKSVLYNQHMVTGDTIIVTEGPFDAWRLGPPAVCTFGVNVTESQLELMLQYKNIYILFDFDSAGAMNAATVGNTLLSIDSTLNVVCYRLNAWPDPASIPPETISKVRAYINSPRNRSN